MKANIALPKCEAVTIAMITKKFTNTFVLAESTTDEQRIKYRVSVNFLNRYNKNKMQTDKCQNCEHEFAWDVKTGLNVKYYEAEATPKYFRAGGDAPCCPNCEQRVEPRKTVFGWHDIKFETRFVRKKPETTESIGLLPEKPRST